MARNRANRNRVYPRTRNGGTRYWGDFRDFSDVGGALEPLRPAGERFATQDLDEAVAVAKSRLIELKRLRMEASVMFTAAADLSRLDAYIEHHLVELAQSSAVTPAWLEAIELHLDTARDFFPDGIRLAEFRPRMIKEYIAHLASLPSGRLGPGGTVKRLAPSSQRKYLNSLSGLFTSAIEDGLLPMGANAVAGVKRKPSNQSAGERAAWLEVHIAALLLHAAMTYVPKRADMALPCAFEVLATLMLTGAREPECYGMYIEDVNFERETITIWPNEDRRLKNDGSQRVMRLWPQLAAILKAYLAGPLRPTGRLLFPREAGTDAMITDLRSYLNTLADRISWSGPRSGRRCFATPIARPACKRTRKEFRLRNTRCPRSWGTTVKTWSTTCTGTWDKSDTGQTSLSSGLNPSRSCWKIALRKSSAGIASSAC